MQPNKTVKLVSLITALVLAFTGIGLAQNMGQIQQKMKARLPVILDLKRKGIVGEDNRGYLGFVGNQKPNTALVNQENKDRKTIYMHIAKQHNIQLAVVERQRAGQLAKQAAKGTYFMNAQGKWVKK